MNPTVEFTVQVQAVGQPRQRFMAKHSKKLGRAVPVAYKQDGHPVEAFKDEIVLRFREARPAGWPTGDGWVYRLLVVDVRAAPQSKGYAEPVRPNANKPDLDNVMKAIKDALKGVAYRDDCLVYDERAVKVTAGAGERPWVRVVLTAEPAASVARPSAVLSGWGSQTIAGL